MDLLDDGHNFLPPLCLDGDVITPQSVIQRMDRLDADASLRLLDFLGAHRREPNSAGVLLTLAGDLNSHLLLHGFKGGTGGMIKAGAPEGIGWDDQGRSTY